MKSLSKPEFKRLLFLATRESHFVFDGMLSKQIHGAVMASPLRSTLANAFLVAHEKN